MKEIMITLPSIISKTRHVVANSMTLYFLMVSNIPLSKCTIVSVFSHLFLNTWVDSRFGSGVQMVFLHLLFGPLGYYSPKSVVAGSNGSSTPRYFRNVHIVFLKVCSSHFHQQCKKSLILSTPM